MSDESKDQISLFDLTAPAPAIKNPVEKTSVPAPRKSATTETVKTSGKKMTSPGAGKKPLLRKPAARLATGPVPDGDVRLTANIRQELHLKLKIAAATRRTTIGELIEELVEQYL
jgi:ParG protein